MFWGDPQKNRKWRMEDYTGRMCIVDKITFETLIKEVKHTYGSGFAKRYRDMPEGEFVRKRNRRNGTLDVPEKGR